jgi:hypothetical protein
MKKNVYDRITAAIVADLEKGVRPWLKPWNAEHAAGRISRPLRANGVPYKGINVLIAVVGRDGEGLRRADLLLDGKAYSWRANVEARRQQLEAWRAAKGTQPTLFEIKQDCRPTTERTAAERYLEPSLLDWCGRDEEHLPRT